MKPLQKEEKRIDKQMLHIVQVCMKYKPAEVSRYV